MTSFEEAVAFLTERGIEFRQGDEYVGTPGVDRRREDRPWIEGIAPPFSAEEWLDIVSADSELLGSCCGTISAARDILFGQVRQDRWLDGKDLWEFVEILSHHDGFEFMLPKTDENYEAWSSWHQDQEPQDDPLYRLWEVYDKIKDHLKIEVPHTDPYPEDAPIREPITAALSLLYGGIHGLYWGTSCFSKDEEGRDPAWMKQQKHARRQLTIARLLPALRDVLTHIDKVDLGDFEGFAACKKHEPEEVCKNSLGLCVFADEQEAQGMIDQWSKTHDEQEEPRGESPRDTTIIRRVSVSSKEGLTFLDKEPT